MSEPDTQPVCEACGKPVDPNGADVVKAMPVMTVETVGMTGWIDGMGVYFHDDCYPYGTGDYILVDS
jgi:hypothetical protein